MNEGFLSQDEIDSLLEKNQEINGEEELNEEKKDVLGELGNISMATAATALSTILGKKVTITTPQVEVTNLMKLQKNLTIPNVVLQVKFEEGLHGTNILLINIEDASIIANLMMGGDGSDTSNDLSEIEISAVSEAMNQMIGSASTSMATMLKRGINIYPPHTQVWDNEETIEIDDIQPEDPIVKIAFRMTVNGLIDSEIMQIFTMDTVEDIMKIMKVENQNQASEEAIDIEEDFIMEQEDDLEPAIFPEEEAPSTSPSVSIKKPQFGKLHNNRTNETQNIDLILDVPLEFSVILGKTQRTIKDVLSLSPGSIVELNKYAEEPLEIYVNGKLIAQGEVVVINENFGIRITNIISTTERVKKLR